MLALGHQARRTLLTLFVVSPFAREGGRRSGSSLCMASGSTSSQPAWVTLIDESIRKNDVAHKNFGTPMCPCRRCSHAIAALKQDKHTDPVRWPRIISAIGDCY